MSNDESRRGVMELYYASPVAITPDTEFGRFGEIVYFEARPYFQPARSERFCYRVEVDEGQILPIEQLLDLPLSPVGEEQVACIQELFECSAAAAGALLTGETLVTDPGLQHQLNARAFVAAASLGFAALSIPAARGRQYVKSLWDARCDLIPLVQVRRAGPGLWVAVPAAEGGG